MRVLDSDFFGVFTQVAARHHDDCLIHGLDYDRTETFRLVLGVYVASRKRHADLEKRLQG